LRRQHLVVNGVFRASVQGDALADALQQLNQDSIDAMPALLNALPQASVPLRTFDTVGLSALRALLDDHAAQTMAPAADDPAQVSVGDGLDQLVDELAGAGKGLIMVMGKGGVGKTTTAVNLAAGLALRLGDRAPDRNRILLVDMDPQVHALLAIGYDKQAQTPPLSLAALLTETPPPSIQRLIQRSDHHPNLFFVPS
jgi:anion-transporting  ArsA/GET3 family ATPase